MDTMKAQQGHVDRKRLVEDNLFGFVETPSLVIHLCASTLFPDFESSYNHQDFKVLGSQKTFMRCLKVRTNNGPQRGTWYEGRKDALTRAVVQICFFIIPTVKLLQPCNEQLQALLTHSPSIRL